jgi:peptide/nickel transport system permease protein
MFRRLLERKTAAIGLAILCLLLLLALLAPLTAPGDPLATDLAGALRPPSAGHIFGQDRLGRDVLAQVAYGARASALIALCVVAVTAVAGTGAGATAAYLGGAADTLLMRVADVFLAFPGILLAIALAGVLGPSLANLILALSVMGWVGYARLVRSQVLTLREREYVAAAQAVEIGRAHV